MIKKSESPYSSPMVVVRKNNGEMRLCCDFRELNSKTIPDRYPLPRIQSILDNLGGNKYYSILDQRKAYHQAFMDPSCSHLTAFVTPWGLYEWVRIPFGLMNAPATFQQAMERLHGYTDKFVIPFLDDILIYSKNFKGHLEHVRNVLRRLIEHGIKLKADKCSLFQSELTFLGRKITEEGYRMGTKNLEALNKFKSEPPTTVGLADEGCLAATMVCKCRRRPLRNGRWPASNQRKALICGRILDPPPYLFTEPAPPMLYFSELHIAGFHKLQNSHPLQTNSARCPALGPQQRQSQLQCRFLANRRD